MDRVKINLTPHFSFSFVIPIRITDLNYGGHVGNDTFLSLIHEARQQYLLHHGFSELKFAGVSLIMADVAIEFKRELNHNDQVKISVSATGFDRKGFDLHYLLEVSENDKYILAGKAKTGMLCYDYERKKIVSIPEEAFIKLSTNY